MNARSKQALILISLLGLFIVTLLAPGPVSAGNGAGPAVGKITSPLSLDLGGIAANLLTLAFFGAGLFFLIQVVIGGISWINAGGDEKALGAARSRLTNAMVGIIIVLSAFALTLIVTTVLGINIFKGVVTIN